MKHWSVVRLIVVTLMVMWVCINPAGAERVQATIVVAQAKAAAPSAAPAPGAPAPTSNGAVAPEEGGVPVNLEGYPYTYDPSSRRDPFSALILNKGKGEVDQTLPPLQRVGLTEITLIGIVWGGFGYTAMVQTPDGKGYSVRRGTRIGPQNGVVTKITKQGITVVERYTDIYGKEEEREHIKLLHTSEESE